MRIALGLLFVGSVSCFSSRLAAQDSTTEPTRQELQQQIQELRGEVKDLRAQVNSAPATQPSADMDQHQIPSHDHVAGSSPLGNLTAGYARDKGFYIRSEDGNFLLHPWAFIQARDTLNYR
ncbi:MAG TPA: hypothetical protein VFW23_01760, partial [Tepidisphaeraceae bacterium]|nr:hypothetical protein [Tepidisphaeraceae bacterium]